jgi:hypothetical protein
MRIVRHDDAALRCEIVLTTPHPRLQPYVREYVGGYEDSATPICRREVPSGIVPVIFTFAGRVRELERGSSDTWTERTTFAAGLHDTFTLVQSTGPSHGLQVNFYRAWCAPILSASTPRFDESHRRAWRLVRLACRAMDRGVLRRADVGGTIRASRSLHPVEDHGVVAASRCDCLGVASARGNWWQSQDRSSRGSDWLEREDLRRAVPAGARSRAQGVGTCPTLRARASRAGHPR